MKQAVCLKHVPFEGPAVFERILNDRGFAVQQHLVPEIGLPESPDDFLLIMGGPMSANDPNPWISNEIQFIRETIRKGTPTLGICLGSQLMAKAIGGTVFLGDEFEIGPTRLVKTETGMEDPITAQIPTPFTVLEWHGEGIQLPNGISSLAASPSFETQAFRAGPQACGILFHLELTRDAISELCRHCPEDLSRAKKTAEDLAAITDEELSQLHLHAEILIDGLLGSGLR